MANEPEPEQPEQPKPLMPEEYADAIADLARKLDPILVGVDLSVTSAVLHSMYCVSLSHQYGDWAARRVTDAVIAFQREYKQMQAEAENDQGTVN